MYFLLTFKYTKVYNEYVKTRPFTGSIEDIVLNGQYSLRPRSNTGSFTL